MHTSSAHCTNVFLDVSMRKFKKKKNSPENNNNNKISFSEGRKLRLDIYSNLNSPKNPKRERDEIEKKMVIDSTFNQFETKLNPALELN